MCFNQYFCTCNSPAYKLSQLKHALINAAWSLAGIGKQQPNEPPTPPLSPSIREDNCISPTASYCKHREDWQTHWHNTESVIYFPFNSSKNKTKQNCYAGRLLGAFIFQFGLLILGVSQLFAAATRVGEGEGGLTAFPSASHLCQLSPLLSFHLPSSPISHFFY